MTRRTVPLLLVAGVCLAGTSAVAQDTPAMDPPAHVAFVDGVAILERDGERDSSPGSMPLLAGDRLRTEAGRLEVLFADGSALHLDAHTVLDFQSDEVVRLLQGTIRLTIAGPSRDVSYRIDAPSAWVQIADPGDYRVAILRDGDVELAVLRGAAELVNEQGRTYIRAGERTYARIGAAPSPPYVFNSAAWDAFDRWSEDRRAQRSGLSAQYLPTEVRPYAATFDHYGSWRYEQPYGYVWYPRVSVDWRPYYRGRWASLRPYGWTWIGADPWGWPTHHYGRWGFSAGVWFWIPGRHWGPAWVSWAYAPSYVSWCPLGWDNRPVFQIVNVNVFGGRSFSPWHAWTVVPRRHFGGPFVHVSRVATVHIDQRIHRTFVVQSRPPDVRFAVGRTATPIRTAGRYAVPRGGAAASVNGSRRSGAARSPDDLRGAERRLPPPAREPGTAIGGRRATTTAVAPEGSRAVRRDAPPEASGASAPSAAGVPGREARRAPGAATTPPASAAPAGSRAVRRDARPDGSAGAPSPATGPATREVRRAPGAAGAPPASTAPEGSRSRPDVTAAPPGAVRAVPRGRESGSGSASPDASIRRSPGGVRSTPGAGPAAATSEPPAGRARASRPPGSTGVAGVPRRSSEPAAGPAGQPRSAAPAPRAPAREPAARPPAQAPRESGRVRERSAPAGGPAPDRGQSRSRAAPRSEPSAPPSTYRTAPAPRAAPSGAAPSAAPSRRAGEGARRAAPSSGSESRGRRRE